MQGARQGKEDILLAPKHRQQLGHEGNHHAEDPPIGSIIKAMKTVTISTQMTIRNAGQTLRHATRKNTGGPAAAGA